MKIATATKLMLALATPLLALLVASPAHAWTSYATVEYIYPKNQTEVLMTSSLPMPTWLPGEPLTADITHSSGHSFHCEGIAVIDSGKTCVATYDFSNEGGSVSGSETFEMGWTANHIAPGGAIPGSYAYYLNKMKTYTGSRPQFSYDLMMSSTAKTEGHFVTASGLSTGEGVKMLQETVGWALLLENGGGGIQR